MWNKLLLEFIEGYVVGITEKERPRIENIARILKGTEMKSCRQSWKIWALINNREKPTDRNIENQKDKEGNWGIKDTRFFILSRNIWKWTRFVLKYRLGCCFCRPGRILKTIGLVVELYVYPLDQT